MGNDTFEMLYGAENIGSTIVKISERLGTGNFACSVLLFRGLGYRDLVGFPSKLDNAHPAPTTC
jgi:hypothetical protein